MYKRLSVPIVSLLNCIAVVDWLKITGSARNKLSVGLSNKLCYKGCEIGFKFKLDLKKGNKNTVGVNDFTYIKIIIQNH